MATPSGISQGRYNGGACLLCHVGPRVGGQGQEDTVDQNGKYDEVVEELVGGHVDGKPSQRIPRRQQEEGTGGREAVDELVLEAFGYNYKRLKQK